MINKLKKRLNIQRETQMPDGKGGYTSTWNTIATVWGSVRPVSGGEYYKAQRVENAITHIVEIRYRTDITVNDRFEYSGRIFKINRMINENEANVKLVFECEEVL